MALCSDPINVKLFFDTAQRDLVEAQASSVKAPFFVTHNSYLLHNMRQDVAILCSECHANLTRILPVGSRE